MIACQSGKKAKPCTVCETTGGATNRKDGVPGRYSLVGFGIDGHYVCWKCYLDVWEGRVDLKKSPVLQPWPKDGKKACDRIRKYWNSESRWALMWVTKQEGDPDE